MRTIWQVEAMRITVFPSDIAAVDMPKLWDSVMDQEPDAIHFQKDSIDAREGAFGNGRLVLAKHTDKIDWRYLSIPNEDLDDMRLPIIGYLDEELKTFVRLAKSWLVSPDMPTIKRLAFGAVLLRPVDLVEDGYSILQNMLPWMNAKSVRDFNYQVNRRRTSRIDPKIEVNRLNKWNVYSGKLVTVAVNPVQEQQISSTTDLSIASRLELDINTFPERKQTLPTHTLLALFDELVEWGLEISEKGDIE